MPAANSTSTDPDDDALVARLCDGRPADDPRAYLRVILDGWRHAFLPRRLPVDVEGLASARGIRVVTSSTAGDWDGRVFADGPGRVTIEVDARHAAARRRFTVAHELVHTAFPGFEAEERHRVDRGLVTALLAPSRPAEERLCDWGAGILLMPDELIWSYRADQGLRAVERLARDAQVSLESAVLRIVERATRPVVLLVVEAAGETPRVQYVRAKGLRTGVSRGTGIAPASAIARAIRSGRREREDEPLPGQTGPIFHVDAKSYPVSAQERVLALAWPRAAA